MWLHQNQNCPPTLLDKENRKIHTYAEIWDPFLTQIKLFDWGEGDKIMGWDKKSFLLDQVSI